MTIVRARGLKKQIQGQILFESVDLTIEDSDRIGIIGVNGSGKSTLMKCLANLVEIDAGELWYNEGYRVRYLGQAPEAGGELTVEQAVYQAQQNLLEVYHRYLKICDELEKAPEQSGLLGALDECTQILDHGGFFDIQTRAAQALERLGLTQHLKTADGQERLVEQLSGGQRRRVDLAAALVSQPDLLLLDEPTNHLDTESVEWLEAFLRSYKGAVLMVTHDRYFLDRITNRTLELDQQKITLYQGNYASYLEKKAEIQAQAEATAAKRANLWRRELEWLRRGPRARATKSKSRIERALELQPERTEEKVALEFQFATARLGTKVIVAEGISKAYGERKLFADFDFIVEPGAKIGIIGPNGSGKSSLLDIFAGSKQPDKGTIERGTTVKIGYFDQENRELPGNLKVLEALREVAESIPLTNGQVLTASQMLDRFLFSGRLQHTLVSRLSGGEKRRLLLLQTLIANPNVLILDEPTNDLDIPTLSCLEDFLDHFGGSLIVSSHDRYFLDRNTEELLAFEGGKEPRRFTGSYSDYVKSQKTPEAKSEPRPTDKLSGPSGGTSGRQQTEPSSSTSPAASATSKSVVNKVSYKQRKEFEDLESKIPQLEDEKRGLESELATSGLAYATVQEKYARLEVLKTQISTSLERWSELAELIEVSP